MNLLPRLSYLLLMFGLLLAASPVHRKLVIDLLDRARVSLSTGPPALPTISETVNRGMASNPSNANARDTGFVRAPDNSRTRESGVGGEGRCHAVVHGFETAGSRTRRRIVALAFAIAAGEVAALCVFCLIAGCLLRHTVSTYLENHHAELLFDRGWRIISLFISRTCAGVISSALALMLARDFRSARGSWLAWLAAGVIAGLLMALVSSLRMSPGTIRFPAGIVLPSCLAGGIAQAVVLRWLHRPGAGFVPPQVHPNSPGPG